MRANCCYRKRLVHRMKHIVVFVLAVLVASGGVFAAVRCDDCSQGRCHERADFGTRQCEACRQLGCCGSAVSLQASNCTCAPAAVPDRDSVSVLTLDKLKVADEATAPATSVTSVPLVTRPPLSPSFVLPYARAKPYLVCCVLLI